MQKIIVHSFGVAVLLLTSSCADSQRDEAGGLLEGVPSGRTEIIDLTHPLNSKNPHWPGPGYEPFHYEIFATLEKNGVLSGRFSMPEHAGTHVDAPNHFEAGQIPVDRIPPRQLFCPAVVIDVQSKAAQNPDYMLSRTDIAEWEAAHGRIPENALVFLYSGWDKRWDDFEQYKNASADGVLHFPGFSAESVQMLVDERNAAALGIDTLSVDPGVSKDFAVHHVSHKRGKYHVENAANLSRLPPTGAFVVVAPIKIENGTGGPARVFALVAKP